MSIWFSEFHVRSLSERIAPKIAPAVERAILATVRQELPGLLMAELRDMLPEYTPKRSVASRRDRDTAIRQEYTGRNVKALAAKYHLSPSQVFRIVAVR